MASFAQILPETEMGTAAGGGGRGPQLGVVFGESPLGQPAASLPMRGVEGHGGSRSYANSRARLETYFDRTARTTWERLTSDAPVGSIRATVRAGRDAMRATLLDWLPDDMTGLRLLDAGCGTGALAVEAAKRGASVVAIDVAAGLIEIARERAPAGLAIEWLSGDMLDPALGTFDHVVAMDSLIHYRSADIVRAAATLGRRTRGSLLFTIAPSTPALRLMHLAGKLFPRGNRSPAIQPVAPAMLTRRLSDAAPSLRCARDHRVTTGFYISHAIEVVPA